MALAAVSLLVFFNNYWTNQFLKSGVLAVAQKPLAASSSFLKQTGQRVVSWFSTGQLIQENQNLKTENRQFVSVKLKISELEKENDFLRKELGIAKRKNYRVALSRIFHQEFGGQFQTALIDVGSNEGIKAGLPVILEGEVLYGLVKEVYSSSALIYLITDPRIALSVKISNSESAKSEIIGRSRGRLQEGVSLELVTNQEEVKPGELVITSGLDGLPSALIIGRIKTTKPDRGNLFQEIEIEPQFKSLSVDKVFILK